MTPRYHSLARITAFALFLLIGVVSGRLFDSLSPDGGRGAPEDLDRAAAERFGGTSSKVGGSPSGKESPRSEGYGLTREVPVELLNAGYLALLGSNYSLNEEAKALFQITPEEDQAISTAVKDIILGVRDLMFDDMEVVESSEEGRFEILVPPAGHDAVELKKQFDDRLIASLGYPRAKLLRLMLEDAIAGDTSNFGARPQRVVIEKTATGVSFIRKAMDSESSESYSTLQESQWSYEDLANQQSLPADSWNAAFVRPFFERVGIWPVK